MGGGCGVSSETETCKMYASTAVHVSGGVSYPCAVSEFLTRVDHGANSPGIFVLGCEQIGRNLFKLADRYPGGTPVDGWLKLETD